MEKNIMGEEGREGGGVFFFLFGGGGRGSEELTISVPKLRKKRQGINITCN